MADITELSSDAAFWSTVDHWALAVVAVGVVVEGIAEWLPKERRETALWTSVTRTGWLILVLALAVEYVAQRSKDADDALVIVQLSRDAAVADRDATEAKLALEKLKQPRTLGADRQRDVAAAIRSFAGQRYRAGVSQGADDGIAFWESLYATLQSAGWVCVPQGPPSVGDPPAGIPIAAMPGVEIRFDPAREKELAAPALALGNALHGDGTVIAVNRDKPNSTDESLRDAITIVIGARVPPQ